MRRTTAILIFIVAMGLKSLVVASLLAVGTSAYPLLNPIQVMEKVGPDAGKVFTK